MTSIAPCPFCDSAGPDVIADGAANDLPFFYVVCDACEASGPTENTQDEAIEQWNKAMRKGSST